MIDTSQIELNLIAPEDATLAAQTPAKQAK